MIVTYLLFAIQASFFALLCGLWSTTWKKASASHTELWDTVGNEGYRRIIRTRRSLWNRTFVVPLWHNLPVMSDSSSYFMSCVCLVFTNVLSLGVSLPVWLSDPPYCATPVSNCLPSLLCIYTSLLPATTLRMTCCLCIQTSSILCLFTEPSSLTVTFLWNDQDWFLTVLLYLIPLWCGS